MIKNNVIFALIFDFDCLTNLIYTIASIFSINEMGYFVVPFLLLDFIFISDILLLVLNAVYVNLY